MSSEFELTRLVGYSNAEIENEIRRVADLLGTAPLKKQEFDKKSKVNSSTVVRRFGGWQAALEAAGRGHLYGGGPVTEKMRVQKGRDLSDDDLLAELRRIAQVLGRNDLTVDDINNNSKVGEGLFRKRFGTTRNAIERAGLNVRPQSRRYTDDECFENLFDVWKHYGRQPSFSEMNRPPSKVGGQAYITRFGTWMRGLTTFKERMNAETDSAPSLVVTSASSQKSPDENPSGPASDIRDERRRVPLHLRFKVFRRDRFKCVLCGDHPVKNSECDLHVDHVLPWSRGGRTELANLRTLCALCNVGRGDRYDANDEPWS
jgi:hypothetical protein